MMLTTDDTVDGKLKKPFYQASVDPALEAIRRSVESVNSCVEAIVQRNITQTRRIAQSNERQLHALRQNTKMSEMEMRNMSKQIEEMKEHVQEFGERSLAGLNGLFNLLLDCMRGASRQ